MGKQNNPGKAEKQSSVSPPKKENKQDRSPSPKKNEKSIVTPDDSESVTLFRQPIYTLQIFAYVCAGFLKQFWQFLLKYKVLVVVLVATLLVPHFVPGPHQSLVSKIDELGMFAAWWILLGVASSIGLGTGLHTFVLYLGPHIATVTMVANECNYIPKMLPSRWNFTHFEACPVPGTGRVSFWEILTSVQAEAFLWGLGTALGELPPYFVARAASLAGQKSEEVLQLEHEAMASQKGLPLMERAKLFIYRRLQKWGFLTVLLCASIPNPLFDLAGITCGHFLFPFMKFFLATFIGKAIIKVHIQTLFVIFVFSAHHVEKFLAFIESRIPFLSGRISQFLENQKQKIHEVHAPGDKPLIGKLWDMFIILMVAYFLMSIINSTVNGYLEEQKHKKSSKKSGEAKGQNKKQQ